MPSTRQQLRASLCWSQLCLPERFDGEPARWKDRPNAKPYLGAVKETAARVYSAGVGMAIAFLLSRNKTPAANAANDIASLTLRVLQLSDPVLDQAASCLLERIRGGEMTEYMLLAEEATEVAGWLARYLEGAGVKTDEEAVGAGEVEPDAEPATAS
jgi:hypothetical protein